MSALRKIFAALALVVGLAVGIGIGHGSAAHASSYPTYSTSSRVELVTSPTCLRVHSVTTTYYHWSSKTHSYVPYTGSARTTTTDYTTCHS